MSFTLDHLLLVSTFHTRSAVITKYLRLRTRDELLTSSSLDEMTRGHVIAASVDNLDMIAHVTQRFISYYSMTLSFSHSDPCCRSSTIFRSTLSFLLAMGRPSNQYYCHGHALRLHHDMNS